MCAMNHRLLRPRASGGGFDPRSISGLAAWYDISDLSTIAQNSDGTTPATAENDPVGYVMDKGPSGYHMTQSTNNNRPLLKLNAQNSNPAILFDGVNDFLINSANFLNGSGASVAFVAQRESNGVPGFTNYLHSVFGTGSRSGSTGWQAYLRNTFAGASANDLFIAGGNARRNGSASLGTGTSPTSFMIGTGATDITINIPTTGDGVHLGAIRDIDGVIGSFGVNNFRLHGRIGEVILYTRLLSLAERQSIEQYLSAKWGLELT